MCGEVVTICEYHSLVDVKRYWGFPGDAKIKFSINFYYILIIMRRSQEDSSDFDYQDVLVL